MFRPILCLMFLLLTVVAAPARANAAPPHEPAAVQEPSAGHGPQGVAEQPDAELGDDADPEEPDPAVYAAYIREIIAAKRGAIEDKVADRVLDKQIARMGVISSIFSVVSILGIGLLLIPVLVRKRFPNRGRVLWKYAATSALLFFVTVNLFAMVLKILGVGQMAAGAIANPQVAVVSATFDTVHESAEDLAPLGPALIEPTLASLGPESDEPMPVVLLENAAKFGNELKIVQSVAGMFKRVNWLFGYVPIVLSIVTVVVFLLNLGPTLRAIIGLPVRAAAGERGVARQVAKETVKTVGREVLATLSIMVVLITVMVFASLVLETVLSPALEAFIGILAVAIFYAQIVPDASSGAILVGLGGTVVFLIVDLAAVMAGTGLFVGKVHKIFQRRFHDKLPLRSHAAFWKWGTASLAYILAFPVLYMYAAGPVIDALIEWQMDGDEIRWGLLLTTPPVALVVLFMISAFVFRLHRAIAFIAKYKIPKAKQPVPQGPMQAPPVPVPPVRTGLTQAHPTLTPDNKTRRYRSVE